MKEHKNASALFLNFWENASISIVNFGAELKKIDSNNLIFELDELDKSIFLNFYNKLPIDGDRRFKVKLEFEE